MVNEKFLANPNVSLLPSFDDVVEVIMSDNRQSVFIFVSCSTFLCPTSDYTATRRVTSLLKTR